MYRLQSPLVIIPAFIQHKELGFSVIGWSAFLLYSSLYCLAYNSIAATQATLSVSLLWGIKEYGPWLVMTPVIFKCLHYIQQTQLQQVITRYLVLAMASLSVGLGYRIALELYTHSDAKLLASLIHFFPTHFSVLTFIVLIWHLLLKPQPEKRTTHAIASAPHPTRLLVMKGNGECLIDIASIDYITAAGNYMELNCAGQQYLLRASMKQLEEQLPAPQFVRVHRSHMVNVSAIKGILPATSGNGVVELRNGERLALSKRYKQELKTFKLAAHQVE